MPWQLLIVEDDRDTLDSLCPVFVARGYEVHCATDGRAALHAIREGGLRPDAILLDLMMPIMDGSEFLESRRHEPRLEAVPVIVMTAQPDAIPRLPPPVFAAYEKPVPLKVLVDAVYRACHLQPAP